ncbi:MAG TPA: SDR family oxidoreductase [Candidatus Sulfotelmatobacter sp.]|nr:SDR family oxidoreductase [Candidatus Sulfotelmatobacter sp.]
MTRAPVLVTGASTGIGAATVRTLLAQGFRVWAGVRDEASADALAALGERCTPLTLEVTNAEHIAAAAERIAADGGLYGLVNNAGIAVGGPLEALPVDDLRRQLEVNAVAPIALAQAMLPMLRRTLGRIVMISSVGGRIALPFVGPYAASKHALEALSDALRAELLPSGVDVILVEPGAVKTPIWERGARAGEAMAAGFDPLTQARYAADVAMMLKVSHAMDARGIPAERVADVVARALTARRPRTRYLVGNDAKLRVLLRRFVPDRPRDRLLRAAMRRLGS